MISRQYYFILALVGLVLLTGCAAKNQSAAADQAGPRPDQAPAAAGQLDRWSENFTAVDLSELKPGLSILVMGQQNPDASLTAAQIIVGATSTAIFAPGGQRPFPNGAAQDSSGQPAGPAGSGARPDFSQWQNLSEQDRANLRQQMMAQRPAGGNGSANANGGNFRSGGFAGAGRGQGAARLAGEIISLDDTSLTIKLNDGGSKIVFFSQDTKIFKPKDSN